MPTDVSSLSINKVIADAYPSMEIVKYVNALERLVLSNNPHHHPKRLMRVYVSEWEFPTITDVPTDHLWFLVRLEKDQVDEMFGRLSGRIPAFRGMSGEIIRPWIKQIHVALPAIGYAMDESEVKLPTEADFLSVPGVKTCTLETVRYEGQRFVVQNNQLCYMDRSLYRQYE